MASFFPFQQTFLFQQNAQKQKAISHHVFCFQESCACITSHMLIQRVPNFERHDVNQLLAFEHLLKEKSLTSFWKKPCLFRRNMASVPVADLSPIFNPRSSINQSITHTHTHTHNTYYIYSFASNSDSILKCMTICHAFLSLHLCLFLCYLLSISHTHTYTYTQIHSRYHPTPIHRATQREIQTQTFFKIILF